MGLPGLLPTTRSPINLSVLASHSALVRGGRTRPQQGREEGGAGRSGVSSPPAPPRLFTCS